MVVIKGSEIFDKTSIAELIEDRVIQQSIFPFLSDREKIIEQDSTDFRSQEKAGNREAENEQDILGRLQKRIPASINPMQTAGVLTEISSVRIEQNIGSRKETVHDVLMCNSGFPDRFKMDRTDLIAVDLGENLPVSCSETFPLCLGALWTVPEAAGGNTAIRIQGKKEPVSSVGRELWIRILDKGPVKRVGCVFQHEGGTIETRCCVDPFTGVFQWTR